MASLVRENLLEIDSRRKFLKWMGIGSEFSRAACKKIEDDNDERHASSVDKGENLASNADELRRDEPYDLSIRRKSSSSSEQSSFSSASYRGSHSDRLRSDRTDSSDTLSQNGEQVFSDDGKSQRRDSSTCSFADEKESHCDRGPIQGMNDLRKKRLLCDVIFQLCDKDFPAHKAIMASCSDLCRETFLQPSNEKESVTLIAVDDVSSDSFERLLDFVYTGKLKVDLSNVDDVSGAAKKLKIQKLVRACHEFQVGASPSQTKRHLSSTTSSKQANDLDDRSAAASPHSASSLSDELKHSGSTEVSYRRKIHSDSQAIDNLFETPKPRRASDSITTLSDGVRRRENNFARSPNCPAVPAAEVLRILHESKPHARLGDISNNGHNDGRIFHAARGIPFIPSHGDSGTPAHWKKQQLSELQNGMYPEITKGHTEQVFPNGNHKFSNVPAHQSSPFYFHNGSGSDDETRKDTERNFVKNYFTYNFNSHLQQRHFPNMLLSAATMSELGSVKSPGTNLLPYFGSGPGSALLDSSWTFLRERLQSQDLRQPLLSRELQPFLFAGNGIPRERYSQTASPFCFAPSERLGSVKRGFKSSIFPAKKRKNSDVFDVASTSPRNSVKAASRSTSVSLSAAQSTEVDEGIRSGVTSMKSTSPSAITCSTQSAQNRLQAPHRKSETAKPYRCPLCDANFNRPANLKTHMRIHSGEKPYKCDTCGARFVQVAHLRAHVLIHTGEKPYPCNVCGTSFRHLQTLKSHLRIHTGEKPYSCEQCKVHFRHKSQLRLHLRTKHGIQTNTKKTYKQVPGLCSADICAHIKRAQEAVKFQSQAKSAGLFGVSAPTMTSTALTLPSQQDEELFTASCNSADSVGESSVRSASSPYRARIQLDVRDMARKNSLRDDSPPSGFTIGRQGLGIDVN